MSAINEMKERHFKEMNALLSSQHMEIDRLQADCPHEKLAPWADCPHEKLAPWVWGSFGNLKIRCCCECGKEVVHEPLRVDQ